MYAVKIFLKSPKWKFDTKNNFYAFGTSMDYIIKLLPEELLKTHGSFAIVADKKSEVVIVSDLICSKPLYYCVCNDTIYISDDATEIAKQTNAPFDNENVQEFLKTSYVTETETLFKDIFTTNPATYVRINKMTGKIICNEYYKLTYDQTLIEKKENLIDDLDKCIESVFRDLIKRLNGKTAVIPLSGGCDSRTVACMLKRLGYNDVICFSYGKEKNDESEVSRIIANNLGYKWYFVEYNADVWRNFYKSPEYKEFLEFSSTGSRLGCIQAYPAVKELKNQGVFPEDSVFIPGHALDFTFGSHFSQNQNNWGGEETRDYIIQEHYFLKDAQEEFGKISKWENIVDEINGGEITSLNSYMQWEWHNRQCKYIANDVRTYEFFGYDYELPFWDIRIQEFARHLSFSELFARSLQYKYTKEIIDPACNLSVNYEQKKSKNMRLKSIIKRIPPVKAHLEKKRKLFRRYNDSNAFLSWLTDEEYLYYSNYLGRRFNIDSIVADDYIKLLEMRK